MANEEISSIKINGKQYMVKDIAARDRAEYIISNLGSLQTETDIKREIANQVYNDSINALYKALSIEEYSDEIPVSDTGVFNVYDIEDTTEVSFYDAVGVKYTVAANEDGSYTLPAEAIVPIYKIKSESSITFTIDDIIAKLREEVLSNTSDISLLKSNVLTTGSVLHNVKNKSQYGYYTDAKGNTTTIQSAIAANTAAIIAANRGQFRTVESLPDADDTQLGFIYLVSKTATIEQGGKGTQNPGFIEWVCIKLTDEDTGAISYKWEEIGDTDIDLSDYITTGILANTVQNINNTIIDTENRLNDTITAMKANTITVSYVDAVALEATVDSDFILNVNNKIVLNGNYGIYTAPEDQVPDSQVTGGDNV